MTSKEWIELFFSESFEKQINDLILEDIDYEVPRESILNYVLSVIDVPYMDFLDYVSNLQHEPYGKFDIPYFENYKYCEKSLVEYFISQDNMGCTAEEIGKYFACFVKDIKGSITAYGSKHLYSAKILGLVYEYYNHWYLNCIGYVYGSLNNEQRTSLIARTLLRSPFYKTLLSNRNTSVIYFEDYMNMFSDRFVKMRLKSILIFSEICMKEAQECNVVLKIKSSSKKYKTINKILNVDNIIPKNASNSLKLYFKEIKSYPIISEFDIKRLLNDYRNGNQYSLSLIVKASQLTVIRIALSYKFAPLQDIIQEGNVGVMKAISSFDLESGISFYGFLSFWVKRIIQTFSTSYPYLVHVPINKLFLLDSFEIRVQKYLQEYEFMPSCEILEYENLSEKETKWAYDLLCNIDSMVYPLKEETLYADEQYSPDSNLEMDSLRYRLEQNLYFLSVREQDIITSYFNLNGQGEESFYDIAERYNMSRERIRQIYERGKKRLRILYKFHYLPSLLTTAEREYVMARFDARRVETYRKNLMISKRTEDESKKAGEYKTLFKERNYEKERTSIAQDTSENHTQQKPVQRVQENKVVSSNTILRLAKIGERIIYDEKLGTVINKITMGGFARLIIEYDDGTIDNVPNNTKRYRII